MKDVEPKNILIVRTDRIGDVILTTPAIKALKERFAHAKISVLISDQTSDLLQGSPYINDILIDDRQGRHRGPFGYWRLVIGLRKRKFDAAIIFHTKRRTNLACFLAGIPNRIGYKNSKYGFLLTHPIQDDRAKGERHESQYCLDVLQLFGLPSETFSLECQLQEESENWADKFWREQCGAREVVVIHPGASDPSKMWPAHFFAEVIDNISLRSDYAFVMIGSEQIADAGKKIANSSKVRVVDCIGKTTVGQMASLLKRAKLLISNDSGPVHIAAALKTPVISIFTRNQPGINPERWMPLGSNSRFVSVPPNQDISFKKAGEKSADYLELIPPQQVLEEVDAILKV